jgi:hypothetical protein
VFDDIEAIQKILKRVLEIRGYEEILGLGKTPLPFAMGFFPIVSEAN